MEELKNLKTMRDSAWTRIRDTNDFKLASRLDSMISDLEEALVGEPPRQESSGWRESLGDR
jgi:hypothetical protein